MNTDKAVLYLLVQCEPSPTHDYRKNNMSSTLSPKQTNLIMHIINT